MGYCGLDHWTDVDGASDLRYLLAEAKGSSKFSKIIQQHVEDEGNACNPCGAINLVLLIESGEITPADVGKRNMFAILDKITQLIEQVNDEFHDKAYIRLYHVVKKALRQTNGTDR